MGELVGIVEDDLATGPAVATMVGALRPVLPRSGTVRGDLRLARRQAYNRRGPRAEILVKSGGEPVERAQPAVENVTSAATAPPSP